MRGLSLWFNIITENMAELRDFVGRADMAETQEMLSRVLLPLQLSLGIFQIMKTTPLWAVVRSTLSYFLNCFHFPYTDYKKLQKFEGRVFKRVICHATTAGDAGESKREGKSDIDGPLSVYYLGKKFELTRMDGNKMVVNDGPAYYITSYMWETMKYIRKVAEETVFIKSHKEIWEEVVTGDIMEFEEVLDSVILDNRSVIRLDHDYFLPVNLLKSEDKLLKILNLLGLFLQSTKHVSWLIPILLSFTSAVMGLSTTLRLSIDNLINAFLCRTVHMVCDRLDLLIRRRVYTWGNWVENLKPSNDLQSKIVRDYTYALVAGGAKVDFESLAHTRNNIKALVPEVRKTAAQKFPDWSCFQYIYWPFKHNCANGQLEISDDCESLVDPSVYRHEKYCCKVGPFFFKCDSVYIGWIFDRTRHRCSLKAGAFASHEAEKLLKPQQIVFGDDDDCKGAEILKISTSDCCEVDKHENGEKYCMSASDGCCCCSAEENNKFIADGVTTASVDVDCSSKEAIKLLILAFHMAEPKSGSLKSFEHNTKTVSVRGFVESINAYVRSGYPQLYKLNKLVNVVVH